MKKYLTPSVDFSTIYVSDVLNISNTNLEFENGNDNLGDGGIF